MIMKRYILPIAALAVSAALTSCGDDDEKVWVTDAPDIDISQNDASYTSLTFEWEAVAGVNQYGYELTDPDGNMAARGVTDDNTITFTGLKPSTTYTLTVYIYGPDGTTTRRIVITATTETLVKLATPAVTAEQRGARIDLSWTAVDNAGYYHYSYLAGGSEVSGDTEECSLQLRGIPAGEYTISVTAMSDAEGYLPSEAANCTFSRIRNEKWSVEGNFTSALLGSANKWNAVMTAYDDGSYTIAGWYGVAGYDLEFTVNADNSLEIESGTLDAWGYCLVESGNPSVPVVNIWPYSDASGVYSAFDGGEEYGMVWYYASDGGSTTGYDTFEWGNDEPDPEPGPETPEIAGSYNVTDWSGYESYWFTQTGNWTEFSYNNFEVTITRDGNNITLSGFLGGDGTLIGTLDTTAKTITFPAQDILIGGYEYRFAAERSDLWDLWNSSVVNDPLVVSYDDNMNIDMSGYGIYSVYDDGSLYVYFTGITQQMSKITQ